MEYRGQQFIFESGARLGGGGMAEVYHGTRRDDPVVHVAIKIPLPRLDPAIRDLFLREAEAAQRVSSPHIVKVVDWGDNPPFIAFEFIEGTTLAQEIYGRQGENRLWSERELAGLYRQLASGMLAINQEVIHRDIKPDNIFLQDAVLKVSDFGIAKYVGEVTRSKTLKGWGTAAYMAPETFRGESVDWHADQYSLGVVFYEVATLQRPFTGDWDHLESRHLYERPPRVTGVVDSLPERLATLIARMLEKRPDQRFQSWQDILTELEVLEKGQASERKKRVEDPLVKKAAEQVETVRSRELEREKKQEEERDEVNRRKGLLDYWAGEFFSSVRSRVDELGASLGEESLQFSTRDALPNKDGVAGQRCGVGFLNSGLTITVEGMSIKEAAEVVLWGTFQVRTNARAAVGNLLLIKDSPPYGTWYEVGMKMLGGVSGGGIEGEDEGCQYEVIGGDRLVLARNSKGLLYQRELRNAISMVNYREELLDFEALLLQLMEILIEDASIESQ